MSKKKIKEEKEVTPEGVESTSENQTVSEETSSEQEQQIDSLTEFQKQLDESKERYLRLSAEFDNFRKRTQREKMDLIKYGSEDVIKAILPLIDDFERAIKSMQTATEIEAVKQGLLLIHGKFSDFLKNNGVNPIEAVGNELDTDVHEAITKIPVTDEAQKGKIVDVVEKGYKLNDKVIRFAKVVVGE